MHLNQPIGRSVVRWVAFILFAPQVVPATDIERIQRSTIIGSGDGCYPSPLLGMRVNTSGMVTSVHSDSFTMQSAAARWSGIAVHTGVGHALLAEVMVGDVLDLSGVVTEISGMTALQNVSLLSVVSRGNSVGTVLINTGHLGTACNLDGEAYEGVLVSMENVNVQEGGTCDAITIKSVGGSATRLSFGAGTLLSSITGRR